MYTFASCLALIMYSIFAFKRKKNSYLEKSQHANPLAVIAYRRNLKTENSLLAREDSTFFFWFFYATDRSENVLFHFHVLVKTKTI